MSLKQTIYTQCHELVAKKLASQQQALRDLLESAESETKSSAGDKFETGRAMLHIGQNQIRQQMGETLAQKAVLDAIDPNNYFDRIELGSLIKLSGGYYFLSTALGKIMVDGMTVIALSLQSPLGARLVGLRVGDEVEINGRVMVVEELL